MNQGINLLREVSCDLTVTEQTLQPALPQGTLRFHLEYPQTPDLITAQHQIAELLGHGNFELFAMPGDDDQPVIDFENNFGYFAVLQFPGLERTLSQRSLFDIGYELEEALSLLSAEPDLSNKVFQDPVQPDESEDKNTEGIIKDVFTANCWVEEPAPENRRWPLEAMRIPQAWGHSDVRGEGVIIAQPDTGTAQHEAIAAANIRLDLGINLVENTNDPTDPLNKTASNSGHGTATSSVIVSQGASEIEGVAPGAQLVPIRCVDDVKLFDASPVVAAVNHARKIGSHVITISLGGLRNRALKKAIKSAIANHIIVVAAAGNCVELVIWPARHSAVIGVGGTNIVDIPWQGSSRGSDVDFCAPAQHVWVARRKPDQQSTNETEAAQGTSFATALTAGVAALWLSHHGRDRLLEVAQSSGMSMQSLFRSAVQATARRPESWAQDDFGAGIIDAEALLKLAPEQITQQTSDNKESTRPLQSEGEQLLSGLDRSVASARASDRRTMVRFQRELSAITLGAAKQGNFSNPLAKSESIIQGQTLSITLKEALASSTDPVFTWLREQTDIPPGALVSQAIGPANSESLINRMQVDRTKTKSNIGANGISTRLDTVSTRDLLDKLEQQIDNSPIARGSSKASRDSLKQEVLTDSEQVLEKILAGKKVESDDTRSNTAYEALVKMQGRPVIRLDDTPINLDDPNLQEWVGKIGLLYDDLPKLSGSVGRIDVDGVHHGTGFVVAPGVIMTNRHVVEGFAAPIPSADRPDRWLFERSATINFSPEADDTKREFVLQEVLFTGPDRITGDLLINHDELDLAFVAVEETNADGISLPKILNFASYRRATSVNEEIFLIGYPAAPSSYPKDENGRYRIEVVKRLRELFGVEFGRCYLSPGLVEVPVTRFAQGTRPISFAHDATSLGGSSGSCVLNFSNKPRVVGLHYGGDWLRANFAHDLAYVSRTLIKIPQLVSLLSSADLTNHEYLRSAVLTSKVDDHIDLSAQPSPGITT